MNNRKKILTRVVCLVLAAALVSSMVFMVVMSLLPA